MTDKCEHRETEQIGYQRVCSDCCLVLGQLSQRRNGPGIEHVAWDIRSHYTFLPPKERRDKVLESYKLSLPLELREEFQKEFEKDDGKKCAKKKKMIIAKYRVACRHSLGFDLEEEVRKLGGKVKIGPRDFD